MIRRVEIGTYHDPFVLKAVLEDGREARIVRVITRLAGTPYRSQWEYRLIAGDRHLVLSEDDSQSFVELYHKGWLVFRVYGAEVGPGLEVAIRDLMAGR